MHLLRDHGADAWRVAATRATIRLVIAGIFVGGASTRMGSPKGLARLGSSPQAVTLIERWRRLLSEQRITTVLVGRREEYGAIDLPVVEDAERGKGPLAGLVALLRAAEGGRAIALACDMPFVTGAMLERLAHAPPAPALAPRREGRWEPLFARYDARAALPEAERRLRSGSLALQGLLDAIGATPFALRPGEEGALADWDTPEDAARGGGVP